MEHTVYNPQKALQPNGFSNTGVICYFNSLVQALLSCTALTELLEKNEKVRTHNRLTQTYWNMIADIQNHQTSLEQWSPALWQEFMAALKKAGRYTEFGQQQEDSEEGLTLLLDMMAHPFIDRLFEHRFQLRTLCNSCNKVCSNKSDESIVCSVHADEISTDLQTYMKEHRPEMDNGFRCTLCGNIGNTKQLRVLTMLPEVLILQFKNYKGKVQVDFPLELTFPGKQGTLMRYRAVAQIEHAGNTSGGHYWARALRQSDKVWMLNDRSVTPSSLTPTKNTYMVFYHVV